jgi:hypothetical protein
VIVRVEREAGGLTVDDVAGIMRPEQGDGRVGGGTEQAQDCDEDDSHEAALAMMLPRAAGWPEQQKAPHRTEHLLGLGRLRGDWVVGGLSDELDCVSISIIADAGQ